MSQTSGIYHMPNFKVQELVPPAAYQRFGDSAIRYIDPRLVACLNAVRQYLGLPMTINNWHSPRVSSAHARTQSGLRLPEQSHHRTFSAHSFGMAFDAVGAWDAELVREDILMGRIEVPHPVRLEEGVSWLHLDVMNETTKRVITFEP